jgi:predicted dinucleotide-binding enzyme
MSRKIGVIGSGVVGQTLTNGFVKHGYNIVIGTNADSKRDELRSRDKWQSQDRNV